ncbi:unnamed protein product [Cyclocybe aegerita]|uniref:C2H2-type domain-containing protein n=1 Tax=Cyclocybe aegerita TaxID=1973307 RepID=A0A8S0XGL8_CYCAE|nr:unnamed protein product [Cyclocybe aegerita]
MEEPMDTTTNRAEEWDEEEAEYEEDDGDDDIDMEAAEIARRLGAELWADISKANAERSAAATTTQGATATTLVHASTSAQAGAPAGQDVHISSAMTGHEHRKQEAIIETMKAVLTLVENDPQAKAALLSAAIPNGPNVLDLLQQCTATGTIARGIAGPLSQIVLTLARSQALFGSLKQSNASAIQLDKGKRKREELDEGQHLYPHPYKRPYVLDSDLQHQVVEAVRIISQTLGSSPTQVLDPALVSSIRLQLHQVFLFAVTSSTVSGPSMHALQEISGLIQVVGVLSGIQIGHSPPESTPQPPYPQGHGYPWNPSAMTTDIGTAVYPCLVAGCHKTFSRLYGLRAHQRSHSSHRPHRCSICPASFARSHDLKRHIKLHENKAWRCEGCQKIFSRRDAIKRHKTGTKNRGPRSELCLIAEVVEVELDGEDGEELLREERRAKLWNGIAVNEAAGITTLTARGAYKEYSTVDEGEINPAVIASIQASILTLHGLLQTLVGNALGTSAGQPPTAPPDATAGQATLASVIARAQSQSLPSLKFIPSTYPGQTPSDPSLASEQPADAPAAEKNSTEPQTVGENPENHQPAASLSMYGLSDEQAHLLEIAIASAASAAQAQAEAEAALEEEEEEDYDEDGYDDSEMEQDKEEAPRPEE